MPEKKTYKICIVGNLLAKGGAEKAHSNLSNFFHSKGIEVHNVIFEDKVEYAFSGELLNLGKEKSETFLQRTNRFIILYKYIRKHKFDYVIDLRYRGTFYGEYVLAKFIFGQTKYVPSIRGFDFQGYFTRSERVARRLFTKAYKIVAVSKALEEEIRNRYNYQNLTTIYNIVNTELISKYCEEQIDEKINYPYIVALGRMHQSNVKQHNVIIKAYYESNLPQQGIKLLLVGDGEKRIEYEQLTQSLKLSNMVIFTGFKTNPYPYMKNAEFMVLASKTEGFPNVILESFACGTPVVSYDCQTGPREMIMHKTNGLLVDNQNREALTQAMNLMIENKELYSHCKSNTINTALKFSPEIIGQQWLEMLKINV